jgi:hypothetical protein
MGANYLSSGGSRKKTGGLAMSCQTQSANTSTRHERTETQGDALK